MSKRYFINNIDTFIGKCLIKELVKVDENGEIEEGAQIMATFQDRTNVIKPPGIKKLLKREKPKLSRKKMLEECDVYIYDLHFCDQYDIDFVHDFLQKAPTFEDQKVLILISNIMSWAQTQRKVKPPPVIEKNPEEEEQQEGEKQEEEENQAELEQSKEKDEVDENEEEGEEGDDQEEDEEEQEPEEEAPKDYLPINADMFQTRVPHPSYLKQKQIEDQFLSLQKQNLKVIVITSGILYGHGEITLYQYFKHAWLQSPRKLPILIQKKQIEQEQQEQLEEVLQSKVEDVQSKDQQDEEKEEKQQKQENKQKSQPKVMQQPLQPLPIEAADNQIPMIHITDLAKVVLKIAELGDSGQEMTIPKAILEGDGEQEAEKQEAQEDEKISVPFVFAFDKSKSRTQRSLIQSIANGIGTGEIGETTDTQLLDDHQKEIMMVDVDMQNSLLLQNEDEENPPEFEWTFENGIIEMARKVLMEFTGKEGLRPLKMIMLFPKYDEQALKIQVIQRLVAEHYRIPVLTIHEIIQEALQLQDELGQDLREELDNILILLKSNNEMVINETSKVLIRVIKWRLSQNDCRNRGYILSNYPNLTNDTTFIFQTQQNLKRIRPKPKKKTKKELRLEMLEQKRLEREERKQRAAEKKAAKKKKKKDNEDDADDDDNDDEKDKEEDEDEEDEEEEEEEKQEEEEEEEEEEEQQEEQEQEEEEFVSKPEEFFPESLIIIKRLQKKSGNEIRPKVIDYFQQKKLETFYFDPQRKSQFEIFESLRIYIERNGRPNNYLQNPSELNEDHEQYYSKMHDEIQNRKIIEAEKKENKAKEIIQDKAKFSNEVISQIEKNEIQGEIAQTFRFRNYLMEFIVPTLSEALIEVTDTRPDDPIDFLAEYLYKKSFDL